MWQPPETDELVEDSGWSPPESDVLVEDNPSGFNFDTFTPPPQIPAPAFLGSDEQMSAAANRDFQSNLPANLPKDTLHGMNEWQAAENRRFESQQAAFQRQEQEAEAAKYRQQLIQKNLAGVRDMPTSLKAGAEIQANEELGLQLPERTSKAVSDLFMVPEILDLMAGPNPGGFKTYRQIADEDFAYLNRKEQETARYLSDITDNSTGYALLGGVSRAVTELPFQMAAGFRAASVPQALARASIAAGGLQGTARYAQDRGEGRSRMDALPGAVASGLITGLTTRAFGATGAESIYRKEGFRGLWNRARHTAEDSGFEFGEEFSDETQQQFLNFLDKDPNLTFGEAFNNALMAGGIGSIVGAGAGAVSSMKGRGVKKPMADQPATKADEATQAIGEATAAGPLKPESKLTDIEHDEMVKLQTVKKAGMLSLGDAKKLHDLERIASGEITTVEPEYRSDLDSVIEETGAGVEIRQDYDPNSPFAGQVATIDRKNKKVVINPDGLNKALASIPKEHRKEYLTSLIEGEEKTHLATPDYVAFDFLNNSTALERKIADIIYTGTLDKSATRGNVGTDETMLGHEMLRMQMQRLKRMKSTEVARMAGFPEMTAGNVAEMANMTPREAARRMLDFKITIQTLEAVNNAIFSIRKALGTRASKQQLKYLDEVAGNIKQAKTVIEGGAAAPASTQREVTDETKKFSDAFLDYQGKSKISNTIPKNATPEQVANSITTRNTGLAMKSVADLDEMLRIDRAARKELSDYKARVAAGETLSPEDSARRWAIAQKVQFPRETITTATQSGNRSKAMEANLPEGLPTERTLDWEKNPEVEAWLREHGKEIGVELPETTPASPRREMSKDDFMFELTETGFAESEPKGKAVSDAWQRAIVAGRNGSLPVEQLVKGINAAEIKFSPQNSSMTIDVAGHGTDRGVGSDLGIKHETVTVTVTDDGSLRISTTGGREPRLLKFAIDKAMSLLEGKPPIPSGPRALPATGEPETPGSLRRQIRTLTPKKAGDSMSNMIRDFASFYDEWMVDRMERLGGDMTRKAASDFRKIIDREKKLYGDLTPVLDRARALAGGNKISRVIGTNIKFQRPGLSTIKATSFLNDLKKVRGAPFGATANVVEAIETGRIGGGPVPPAVQSLINAGQIANLAIGKMAQSTSPGFKAGGKFQRNLTAQGFDLFREGRGKRWERYTYATAKLNQMPLANVREVFREFKQKLNAPGVDMAAIEKMNQDFNRKIPKVVTHVLHGAQWHEIVHSNLFDYLENTARRVTHKKAFRETFPDTEEGNAKLAEVRDSVVNEMGGDGLDSFDTMIRTMQGIPTDDYSKWGMLGPTKLPGQAFRMMNQTVGNLMAKMVLTGQMFVQPGETFAGATPIFLGYKNYARALARVGQLYAMMEQQGDVNRMMHDFSWHTWAPARSAFRIAGNLISKAFGNNVLNEFQEAWSAATAQVVSERIKNQTLSDWEKRILPETFRAMGFNTSEVPRMMQGDAELLGQFERKASAFLTSGNRAISEGSKLEANRLFNSVFRFQSYPMTRANQFRRVSARWVEALGSGTGKEKGAATEQFTRFMFGVTLQGVLTTGIATLAYMGWPGLKIKYEEAKDEPLKFALESFVASIAGPLYLVLRGMKYKGIPGIGESLLRMAFPYSIVREMTDMAQGAGRYRDQTTFDRIGTFLKARTPGTRAIRQGMALTGLSMDDKGLDAALDGFYRWRRDEQGFTEFQDFSKEDVRLGFRTEMKKVVEAIKEGNHDKFLKHYQAAEAQLVDIMSKDSAGNALKRAKVLQNVKGGDLTEEDMKKLRARIGDEAVDRLEYFDLMLDSAAGGTLIPKFEK